MNRKISKKEFYEMSKSFVEYMDFLKQDRKNCRKNQLIKTGMLPHENFNFKIIIHLLPNAYQSKKIQQFFLITNLFMKRQNL